MCIRDRCMGVCVRVRVLCVCVCVCVCDCVCVCECVCVCVHFLSFQCEVFELLPPSVVVQERVVGVGWGGVISWKHSIWVMWIKLCCVWVSSAAFCFQRLQDLMTRMHRENLTRYGELQVLHECCRKCVCVHACVFMDACVHVYLNSLDKCECVLM